MAEPRTQRPADLVVVVNAFPRLSETFVLQELLELERRGARLHVIAFRHPDELVQPEGMERLQAEVEYMPEVATYALSRTVRMRIRAAHAALCVEAPKRYLNALGEIAASPDFSRTALRRSVLLAHRLLQLGSPPLYVHWAHKPATVARFAARLAGVRYGLSAHAKDIWLTPPAELAKKVRDAEVVLTCTRGGQAYLEQLAGGRTPVALVYHGVDTEALAPSEAASYGSVILSVGRLVEKKGYPTLLRAASLMRDRGVGFQLRIAGEGPEWAALQRLVHELDLGRRVSFLGPLTESEVRDQYAQAQVFALACRELTNGDRDGIPNVILEAMACGLPVASTASPGVAEAVVDGECGLLVPQGDDEALAAALARLLADRELRRRLGMHARARAVEGFDRTVHLARSADVLRAAGLLPRDTAPRLRSLEPRSVMAA
jgi:glycosyltransferase involved in cell wall biosynthesis